MVAGISRGCIYSTITLRSPVARQIQRSESTSRDSPSTCLLTKSDHIQSRRRFVGENQKKISEGDPTAKYRDGARLRVIDMNATVETDAGRNGLPCPPPGWLC